MSDSVLSLVLSLGLVNLICEACLHEPSSKFSSPALRKRGAAGTNSDRVWWHLAWTQLVTWCEVASRVKENSVWQVVDTSLISLDICWGVGSGEWPGDYLPSPSLSESAGRNLCPVIVYSPPGWTLIKEGLKWGNCLLIKRNSLPGVWSLDVDIACLIGQHLSWVGVAILIIRHL